MQETIKSNDRIFHQDNGNWLVRIRGNYTLGPFASNADAQDALEHYIAARSPDFVSLNLPRWMHPRFWFRMFSGADKNLPLQKQAGQT